MGLGFLVIVWEREDPACSSATYFILFLSPNLDMVFQEVTEALHTVFSFIWDSLGRQESRINMGASSCKLFVKCYKGKKERKKETWNQILNNLELSPPTHTYQKKKKCLSLCELSLPWLFRQRMWGMDHMWAMKPHFIRLTLGCFLTSVVCLQNLGLSFLTWCSFQELPHRVVGLNELIQKMCLK